jgi:hypothetical protein
MGGWWMGQKSTSGFSCVYIKKAQCFLTPPIIYIKPKLTLHPPPLHPLISFFYNQLNTSQTANSQPNTNPTATQHSNPTSNPTPTTAPFEHQRQPYYLFICIQHYICMYIEEKIRHDGLL